MKFKFQLVIVFLVYSVMSFSQNDEYDKAFLSKTFAKLSTGNSFSSLGNFAALSTTDENIKGSIYFLDKTNLFVFNVNAGATQGVAALFDEGKLNTNVGIGFEYRALFSKSIDPFAVRNEAALKLFELEKRKVNDDYNNGLLKLLKRIDPDSNINEDSDESDIGVKYSYIEDAELAKKIKQLDLVLSVYNKMPIADFNQKHSKIIALVKSLREYRVSLIKQANIVDVDGIYINEKLKLLKAKNEKLEAIKKKEGKIEADYIRLNFFSFGYKATNQNFIRFVDDVSYDNQLEKINYVSHGVSFSFNFISNIKPTDVADGIIKDFKEKPLSFFSFGTTVNSTNNLGTLEEVEVVDTRVNDTENNRIVNKNQNAFRGAYDEGIFELITFADYYTFFDKEKEALAIHLNPVFRFREDTKPLASFQVGLLIPFKTKDKEDTSVNLELFYRIKDVFNTTDSESTLLNRNIIGIQTTFPFNF